MQCVLAWMRKIRWPVLFFLAISALLIAPFVGGKVVESAATLIGSALGTMAAVAGALWVAERQISLQRKSAANLIYKMFFPTVCGVETLAIFYGPPSRPDCGSNNDEPDILTAVHWETVAGLAQSADERYKKFTVRIHRYEAGLNLLSARSLTIALALEAVLEETMRIAVLPLTIPNAEDGHGRIVFGDAAPSWMSRYRLQTQNRLIQDLIIMLKRETDGDLTLGD